jgi:putative ABC transport system permease protein
MLAAIALLTGGFLVFSAQALSVVRRRTEFAFLRALGLARRSLFGWLLAEGATVGLAGGVLGVALGHGLAWGALALLGGDLGAGYFSGSSRPLHFAPLVSATYVLLGLLAGIAGRLAAGPRGGHGIAGTGIEGRRRSGAARRPRPSLAGPRPARWPALPPAPFRRWTACRSAAIWRWPACWPAASCCCRRWQPPLPACLPQRGPVPARLAAARLGAAPGHAVVAAAGVLTSVALAVAMAIMVASFRDSVDQWLTQILPADLYLRAGQAKSSAYLDEALQARIAAVPGVDRVSFTRHDNLRLAAGAAPVALIARPLAADGQRIAAGRRRPRGHGAGDLDFRSHAGPLRLAHRPGSHPCRSPASQPDSRSPGSGATTRGRPARS